MNDPERDIRLLHDDGDYAVVTITEVTRVGNDLSDRIEDAISEAFDDDDSVTIIRSGD